MVISMGDYKGEQAIMNFAYTIAGSEATGGAGFQVDIKTFQKLGVYGSGALTCIVSFDPNNNWGHKLFPVPVDVLRDQLAAALGAQDIRTAKIGMLGSPATIDVVSETLRSQEWDNIVVDPVLICKGQEPGQALDTDTALREKILPLATVTTPNNFEARTLSGMESLETVEDLVSAAQKIAEFGPKAVVVKGGIDFPGKDAVDVLWDGENAYVFRAPKVGNERVSGAGCTLAAAITAELAKGATVKDAVAVAKDMVTAGIDARVSAKTPFDTVWQGAYTGQGNPKVSVEEFQG